MKNYNDLINEILLTGTVSGDRTGVGTTSIFGTKLSWNLADGFPATTSKKLAWKAMSMELKWFLSGSTNVNDLRELMHGSRTEGFTIWDANYDNQAVALGYRDGDLGPVYGKQFHHENQLMNFIQELINNPTSRRHIITLWNPSEIDDMALPPCHGLVIQANVRNGKLDMQWYQRSVDCFLGLPFNIASYALFTHIIASIVGLEPGVLTFVGGDTHIYNNHIEQCRIMLAREPFELPTLQMPKLDIHDIQDLPIEEFKLLNYKSHEAIKAPMAV